VEKHEFQLNFYSRTLA